MSGIDWQTIFSIDTPLLEIFVRGSVMYLAIFFLFRTPLRRLGGTLDVPDLIVVVVIADAAQNGMAGDYKSVPDGIFLILTIMFWSFALDWLSYHSKWARKLVQPSAVHLVQNGHLNRRNMQRELITREELMSQLREQGVQELKEVKSACIEGDGRISVIKVESEN